MVETFFQFAVAMETNQRSLDSSMNRSQAAEDLIQGLSSLQQCKYMHRILLANQVNQDSSSPLAISVQWNPDNSHMKYAKICAN